MRRIVRDADRAIAGRPAAVGVAVVSGAVFVLAGLVKFVFYDWELRAFRTFGLPWAPGMEILAGAVETGGGVLLVLRLLVAPVALVLAVTMAVAIGVSGIGHGDVLPSLTLAPALLAAMVYLLLRGLGPLGRSRQPAACERLPSRGPQADPGQATPGDR